MDNGILIFGRGRTRRDAADSVSARLAIRVLLILAVALSACTPVASTATIPPPANEAKATATHVATSVPLGTLDVDAESLRGVTVMVWHPWFGVEASFIETQAADFNASNQWGIKVLTVSQSNYAELFTNVTASLATPDKPNLVIGLPEHALVWDERDGVVDLMPYLGDSTWGMSADEIADFPSVIWEQDQVGERRLGMPAQRTARLLLYNQTWGRELGFDAPPATSDDFHAQTRAANAVFRLNDSPTDDALGGWYLDTNPLTPFAWMLAFGGGPQEEDGYRFRTPNNLAAFRYLRSLFEEGSAWQSSETGAIEAFATRRALFITAGLEDLSAQSRAFNALASADEWTVIPFPGTVEETMIVHGSSFIVIPSTDAEQLAAWLFVRWMLSTENQARWVTTMGMFPLRTSTLNLVADYAATHPQWVQAVKLLPRGQGTPRLASWRLIRGVLGDGFEFMFRVSGPAGEAAIILAQMDTAVQDLAK